MKLINEKIPLIRIHKVRKKTLTTLEIKRDQFKRIYHNSSKSKIHLVFLDT